MQSSFTDWNHIVAEAHAGISSPVRALWDAGRSAAEGECECLAKQHCSWLWFSTRLEIPRLLPAFQAGRQLFRFGKKLVESKSPTRNRGFWLLPSFICCPGHGDMMILLVNSCNESIILKLFSTSHSKREMMIIFWIEPTGSLPNSRFAFLMLVYNDTDMLWWRYIGNGLNFYHLYIVDGGRGLRVDYLMLIMINGYFILAYMRSKSKTSELVELKCIS